MAETGEQTIQEKNKQIVAKYSLEFWGKGNPDIVDELCSDDFVSHYPMHGRRSGKSAIKQMLVEFKEVRPILLLYQKLRCILTFSLCSGRHSPMSHFTLMDQSL